MASHPREPHECQRQATGGDEHESHAPSDDGNICHFHALAERRQQRQRERQAQTGAKREDEAFDEGVVPARLEERQSEDRAIRALLTNRRDYLKKNRKKISDSLSGSRIQSRLLTHFVL